MEPHDWLLIIETSERNIMKEIVNYISDEMGKSIMDYNIEVYSYIEKPYRIEITTESNTRDTRIFNHLQSILLNHETI